MFKTSKNFYLDSFQKNETALIKNIIQDEKHGMCVVFDKTIFYPHGGGQKGDKGGFSFSEENKYITNLPEKIKIFDTRNINDGILHILDPSDFSILDVDKYNECLKDQEIALTLDWGFRLKQMRLHAIAHLLHFFLEEVIGEKPPHPDVSDLQDGYGINKYKGSNIVDDATKGVVEKSLKQYIKSNIEIEMYPDENNSNIRFWRCGKYVVPCGGTHLKNTKQIGDFSIKLSSRKGYTTLKFELK